MVSALSCSGVRSPRDVAISTDPLWLHDLALRGYLDPANLLKGYTLAAAEPTAKPTNDPTEARIVRLRVVWQRELHALLTQQGVP